MNERGTEEIEAGRISFVPVGIGFLGLAVALAASIFWVEETVGRIADGAAAAAMAILGVAVLVAEAVRLRRGKGAGR